MTRGNPQAERFDQSTARGGLRARRQHGADWVVETPEGTASVRSSERNSRGVLDYVVRLPGAAPIYVPLRVVAAGEGCQLVLTVFAADAEWRMRDLLAAKRILEL